MSKKKERKIRMAKCKRCGNHGMFLSLSSDGLCVSCLEAELSKTMRESGEKYASLESELSSVRASITPEMQNAISLQNDIASLKKKKETLDEYISNSQAKYNDAVARLSAITSQIISASDDLEFESFALYRPKYKFTTSEAYKVKLEAVRDKQKDMIRGETAAFSTTGFTLNGSASEGRKMVRDMCKLFLRAFNNECEAAVSSVKFSNYDRCLARIEKSFEAINKLGKTNTITLSSKYLELKKAELALAYEYERKKQEEKEEQAEIRRREREQAQLDKEIEAARKAANKEKQHYEQALADINARLLSCSDQAEHEKLLNKKGEIMSGLDGIERKLEDIDYRQSNQRAGYVYVISNLGSFGENVFKIGMTRRLNPMDRVDELGDASVPFAFDVHAMIFSADAPALEAALHKAFENKRLNKVNARREYFRVTLDEIKEVVRKNHDSTVEFIESYAAEQYRESLKM